MSIDIDNIKRIVEKAKKNGKVRDLKKNDEKKDKEEEEKAQVEVGDITETKYLEDFLRLIKHINGVVSEFASDEGAEFMGFHYSNLEKELTEMKSEGEDEKIGEIIRTIVLNEINFLNIVFGPSIFLAENPEVLYKKEMAQFLLLKHANSLKIE